MWHVDKYKITFKLVINSSRISRGPAVEEHCCKLPSFWRKQDLRGRRNICTSLQGVTSSKPTHNAADFFFLGSSLFVSFVFLASRCRTRWPCGLRRRSPASLLLGLRLRIPSGCLSVVTVVCCKVEVSETGRSLVQRSPIERVFVIECHQIQQ